MSDEQGSRWGAGWAGWPGPGWVGPGWGGGRGGWPGHGPGGHGGFGPHGHRPGPPPWVRDLMRQFGGPHLAPPRGPRARRGDVRAAILDVLAGDEMNGYQVIQQISERTGGAWKPSPGSIYPTVQQLEDEGLVEGRDVGGRRLLRLTDEGRAYVEQHADEMAATWAPFEPPPTSGDAPADGPELLPAMSQVAGALWQVMTTGTAAQRAEATEIMRDTRRRLYGLLADGDDGPPAAE
ncbi:MAG TPA: PadR family transcriptional regulator [Intrasporangium sp.]|uniref:PadR family transcriptional regulator n=1 Tax=Intrasporangium sp. TaxID=1925024 RepID=UPI002D7A2695|nr:PadR family transcriptional regulator [Intrasporangium sp.]HET7397228.1 PadR family transcriptional regulator [Intrasporangium sp.]